eukprot:gene11063-17001_t
MNVRYALAFLTLLVVIAMPFIVFQVNQQQQLSPSKRRTLEQQLARMKTVQETQQKVIETLREELRHTKAADVAKEELHETKADTQGKDINAKQDAESCVDSNENCPGWVDCCPNGTGEGSQCGDTDCSRPGDAPCEGLWMRGACKLTDYFESHMLKYVGAGNRVATSIVFLNNLHEGEGGGTKLVYAKPEPVLVTPKTGTGILFYNVKRNQMVDRSSEHEAIPPKEGFEKWVAILWIRLRPWS